MSKWVDLGALRSAIAQATKTQAEDAGLENVRVHVRIEPPDKRGHRAICVEVTPLTAEQAAEIFGQDLAGQLKFSSAGPLDARPTLTFTDRRSLINR